MEPELADQGAGSEGSATTSAEDLAAVRELILRAHPDVVPELVAGTTVAKLTASVEAARAAYAAVVGRQAPALGTPPVVPAGGATVVVDPATLPAGEKIRRGLTNRTHG